MKMKFIAAALIAAFTGPAFAQSGFYIVQDTATKKCTIVSERPTVSKDPLLPIEAG
jgi:hypothetical protein